MKISDTTKSVLKNFADINQNLLGNIPKCVQNLVEFVKVNEKLLKLKNFKMHFYCYLVQCVKTIGMEGGDQGCFK